MQHSRLQQLQWSYRKGTRAVIRSRYTSFVCRSFSMTRYFTETSEELLVFFILIQIILTKFLPIPYINYIRRQRIWLNFFFFTLILRYKGQWIPTKQFIWCVEAKFNTWILRNPKYIWGEYMEPIAIRKNRADTRSKAWHSGM